jgi:hypothetical protein
MLHDRWSMAGKTIMEATPVPVDLVVSCVDGMPDGATVKIETGMDECVKRLCEKIECKLRLTPGQCMLYHNGRVVNKYCYDWQVVRDWVGIANPTLLYDTDAFPKSLDLTCTMLSGKEVVVKANRRTYAIQVIEEIQSAMGIDPIKSVLRLLFRSTELYPYDRIGTSGLYEDATLEVVVSPTPEYPGWRKLAAPITLNFELPDFTSASVKVTPGHLIGDLYDAIIREVEDWRRSKHVHRDYDIKFVLHNGTRLCHDARTTVWGSGLLEDATIEVHWLSSKRVLNQCPPTMGWKSRPAPY